MISLGCVKNLVDAEIMLGTLARDGLEITNDASLADVIIINTCSFIQAAQEESVDAVLESVQARDARHAGQGLIVAGCLPQRFRQQLPQLLPGVDAIIGLDQVTDITQIVRQALEHRAHRLKQEPKGKGKRGKELTKLDAGKSNRDEHSAEPAPLALKPGPILHINARSTFIPDYGTPRFRLTPRHLAYVKMAEGCNHPCSYCVIPRIRGPYRSRPPADILQEARRLIKGGVKELNLISQDTTHYGNDLHPDAPAQFQAGRPTRGSDSPTLCALLRELNALPGAFWIRLLYTHPAHWTDELIEAIAACRKVARYVDIPMQHIHPLMLERMRRETSQQYLLDLIARIRTHLPGVALRTTLIVGFPGETEACFETLLAFVQATKFERLGVFVYSQEQDTPAARMTGQIPATVKRKRQARIMAAQQQVARQVSAAFVGQTITVLVEREAAAPELRRARVSSWEHGLVRWPDRHQNQLSGRYWVARGEADAPDIDGRVYVRGAVPMGEFAQVKIIGHTDYDLIAEPV
jgi:ribosomal protein S12 methylthiotransferase